ncbi:MAG: hypothetical protein A2Y24_08895 [Clostridiales bacterium GWE2_32_10]|nr:MAG: hypothetical protein A2Y24_08895 [Clostridiales bacterium GWE2_32_10]HBY20234.1 hypothetical protein [Clostridiales bacterium]
MSIRPIDMQAVAATNSEYSKVQQNTNAHQEVLQHAISQNMKKTDEVRQSKVQKSEKSEYKRINEDDSNKEDNEKKKKKYKKYTKNRKIEEDEEIEDSDNAEGHIDLKI